MAADGKQAERFLAFDGEMAALIRAKDWSKSPIGPIETWPATLRSALGLCLGSSYPMIVWWGDRVDGLLQFYNDAYRPILGTRKHPVALGGFAHEIWAEIWSSTRGVFAAVLERGESPRFEDDRLEIDRNGYLEEVWFTRAHSPLRDPDGRIVGIVTIVDETTNRMRASLTLSASEERQAFLLRLGDVLRPLASPGDVQEAAARLLGERLGANRVGYVEIDTDDGRRFTVERCWTDGSVAPRRGPYKLDSFGPVLIEVLRRGETLVVADAVKDKRLAEPKLQAAFAAIDVAAVLAAPLIKDRRLVAILYLHARTPRDWTATEIRLIETVAERTWSTAAQARAETALRESEAHLRSLADAMPQLVWTADAAGRIDYYNARRAYYHGIAQDEAGDWNWLPVVHPEDADRTLAAWQQALATGMPYECEHRLQCKDGRWAWHVSRAECGRDAGGAVTRWYGTAIDIAELKAAKEAAERLNATLERRIEVALAERKLLADIVENADTLVQVVDFDLQWLAINRAAADAFELLFGIRPAVGDRLPVLLDKYPERRERLAAVWNRALAGEAFTETVRLADPGGGERAYEMKFNALRDRSGQRIGAYQFATDVTDRLSAEARLAETLEQLRQSQKMETIGQLTGGVAHDFNNLLTPIVGALELLRRRLDGDERALRLISNGLQAADRARVLVQRLLAFSRRQHLEPRPVDVRTLVESMTDLMSRSLGPRIEVRLDIEDGLPPAQVDPNQLELALLNLAVNGRDAMAGEGRLTIAGRRRPPTGRRRLKPGDYVCLSVTDTGIGMDEETLRRATEPFFTTKGVGKGTGLGLSSVQGLAEQSGGEFKLESAPGKGTTAFIWLPVAVPAVAVGEAGAGEATTMRGAGLPLLLVDDEELVRTATADMLAEAGYRVTEAGSPEQALQLVRDGLDIDVLVTDYAMPGMTGAELARAVRVIKPGLPVLMITGFAALSDKDAAGLPRLAKPYGQTDLAGTVASLLDARKVVKLKLRQAEGP